MPGVRDSAACGARGSGVVGIVGPRWNKLQVRQGHETACRGAARPKLKHTFSPFFCVPGSPTSSYAPSSSSGGGSVHLSASASLSDQRPISRGETNEDTMRGRRPWWRGGCGRSSVEVAARLLQSVAWPGSRQRKSPAGAFAVATSQSCKRWSASPNGRLSTCASAGPGTGRFSALSSGTQKFWYWYSVLVRSALVRSARARPVAGATAQSAPRLRAC